MENEEAWRSSLLSSHGLWCVCGHWKSHIVLSDDANCEEVSGSDWMERAAMRWLRQARENHDLWCLCASWREHALSLEENRILLASLPAFLAEKPRSRSSGTARESCFGRVIKKLTRRRSTTARSSVVSAGGVSSSSGASTVSSRSWQWFGMLPVYRPSNRF
ncbi:protein US31 [Mandrillus leucophaeus cytomegalovirus]|uniref:Protein US31 n=1 Tax=Mandrillus leucophaeus cytomegalovirus TaxID=1654930 RepID=A0A0G2UPB0_9BETA|nr:protein US31 [Mandrillus leucophaeus cytomegalovirus]AKI29736.1 protein US31 [Mandrillus leucophaeus cytomegalovirus]